MLKEAYHPNAYLSNIRNIKLGLKTRTKILNVLDKNPVDAKKLAKETGLSYMVVMHHLRLLAEEGVIKREGSKPYIWVLTGLGQKRLVNIS
jgi:DNA-binding transcriptional ArsR family regulator